MKNPNNPFYKIGTHLKTEPIRLFQRNSYLAKKYLKEVQGRDIDTLFIGWICERDSFFAYMYKCMKKEARKYKKTTLAANIAQVGFPIMLPEINKWILKSTQPILIVPVPSRHGVSERFAIELYKMLDKNSREVSEVRGIFKRSDKVLEIKKIKSWDERSRAVEDIFSLVKKEKLDQKNILLLDDIVTSGSSVRKLAKVLKAYGIKNIAAVSLATNLFDSFSYRHTN